MGILSALASTPPLTVQDAGAFRAATSDRRYAWTSTRQGRRAVATLGEWALAWRFSRGQFVNRLLTLSPYAVPLPAGTTYAGGRKSYPAGLYYVTDMPPRVTAGSGLGENGPMAGVLVSVRVTGASPSLTVTHADAHVSTVAIPPDYIANASGITGSDYLTYIDYPSAVGSVSAVQCVATTYDVFLPRGVIIDPNPANWLTGYAASAVQASDALPSIFDGSMAGAWGGLRPCFLSSRDQYANAGASGCAALPRRLLTSDLWVDSAYGSITSGDRSAFGRPCYPSAGGLLEQDCGHMIGESLIVDGEQYNGGSTSYGLIYSTPIEAVIISDGTDNGGALSRVVTIEECDIDGSSPTTLHTGTYSEVGTVGVYTITLPTTLRKFKRYRVTRSPDRDAGDTRRPRISVYLVPSWHHPLPFSVVASDGAVVPGGVSASLSAAPVSTASVSTSSGLGAVTVPAGRPSTEWRCEWSGLAAGLYYIATTGISDWWTQDQSGGSLRSGRYVLAPGGRFAIHAADATTGGTATPSAVSTTPSAISIGANATAFTAGYVFLSFTAPSSGAYRFQLRGSSAAQLALFASTSDALCCSGLVGVVRNFLRRDWSWVGDRRDSPPSSASPLGFRVYLVGSAPTGAWVDHPGEIASAMVGPAGVIWAFHRPDPGDWFDDTATGNRWHCQDWTDGQFVKAQDDCGHLDLIMASGQTLYLRLANSGPANLAVPDYTMATRQSEYGHPSVQSATVVVSAL